MDTSPVPAVRARLRNQVQQALSGRYQIIRELGFGGMAVVYLAENLDFQRLVAIKVMRPEKGYEDGMAERFRTEAVAVAQLRHPHIIGVHARGEDGDILWFEMDFVPGESLETLLQQGPLDESRVARYLAQAADALAFAHAQGVIHRDIKPSNLLIDASTDYLVITDFGIAKIVGKTSLTETGMTVGTLGYMSPEQLAADRSLTATADQYSLGVVAYECITGARPFPGDSPGELVAAQVTRPPPSVTEMDPACPRDLAMLIHRMMALDPEERWPDLSIVKIAATEIASTGEAPSLRKLPPAPRRSRQQRAPRRIAGLVSVLVMIGSTLVAIPSARARILTAIGVSSTPAESSIGNALQPQLQSEPLTIPPPAPAPVTAPDTAAHRSPPLSLVARDREKPGRDPATTKSRVPAPAQDMAEHRESPQATASKQDSLGGPPRPPVATTATLSIMSALPGTFVYVNGSTQPISISGAFVDLVVPAGTVTLRVSSNQPGCTSRTDQLVLLPGETRRVRRNAECPP
ncbi:MAG: serine/threonine-protein kinase [Gemmatimonadota bacterium]